MSELTKFESIEELKAIAKPVDTTSPKSEERHDWFEGFVSFIKSNGVKDTSRSQATKGTVHGL